MALTRNQILEKSDLPTITEQVDEWGGEIHFRMLRGDELDSYWRYIDDKDNEKMPNLQMAMLIRMVAVDENGVSLFNEGDEIKLAEKNSQIIRRLFDRIKVFAGAHQGEDEEAAKN